MQRKKKCRVITNMLLDKLHSIPISRSYEEHYKLSHVSNCSIPLVCMVALLLLGVVSINPDSMLKADVSAVEVSEANSANGINEDSVEGGEENVVNNSKLRLAPQPTISIDISSDTNDGYGNEVAAPVETAPGGGTAYRSHKVTVSGSNIMTYSLSISGPTNLTSSSGASSTTVNGANGKTGAEMSTSNENLWGYAWGQVDDKVAEMPYNTMQDSGTPLECDSPSDTYVVSCERKLVFGANFNTEASSGSYTAKVGLSLTSTPAWVTYTVTYDASGGSNAPTAQTEDLVDASKTFTIKDKGSMVKSGYNFLGWSKNSGATTADASLAPGQTITLQKASPTMTLYAVWQAITLDSITTMQEMLPAVCESASTGATKSLRDTRGNASYDIVKLNDGRCWMKQNLRLTGGRTLTPADSDVTSNWSMPTTLTGNSTNNQVPNWINSHTEPSSANFGNTTYGVYYNWTVAVAMSDSSSLQTDGTNVNTSICPKGWKLPSKAEFATMISASGAATSSSFVTAGFVNTVALSYFNSLGFYWSRTVYRNNSAHALRYNGGASADTRGRNDGSSVRCIAAQ